MKSVLLKTVSGTAAACGLAVLLLGGIALLTGMLDGEILAGLDVLSAAALLLLAAGTLLARWQRFRFPGRLIAATAGLIGFALTLRGGAAEATAAALLCYAAASLLFLLRRYALGQAAVALALLPALGSGMGHLLGTELIFTGQPALVFLATVLIGAAMLGGTAHRGSMRVFLSKTISGSFARKQVLVATIAPVALALFFAQLLPEGRPPAALAETVAAIIVVCWITFGTTALVGRRLDIKRHKAEAELRNLARHDALTGLLNRRSMNSALPLHHSYAQRDARPITLMMCDLDHFKQLNDQYGHSVGDEVLRRTAQRVSAAVRDTDLVFRYGGEEIAVLLDCGSGDAIRIAEKIRDAVKAPARRQADIDLPSVTISVGAATSARGTTEIKAILEAADECLFAAKDAGRDCVRHVSLP